MQITSCPQDYSGVLSPVLYTIEEIAEDEVVEVHILGENDQISGIKRLHGEKRYSVNVANYLAGRITVAPLKEGSSGFIKMETRTARSKIRIADIVSNASIIAGGQEYAPLGRLLSNSPQVVKLAPGERDEIAFIAPAGTLSARAVMEWGESTEIVRLDDITGEGGLYAFGVDSARIEQKWGGSLKGCTRMTVEIVGETGTMASRVYRIGSANKSFVRICWQNPYGQVDYYTFKLLAESVEVEKNRADVGKGCLVTGIEYSGTYTLVSQCETRATIKWLEEILYARQVWADTAEGHVPVDVITSSATIGGISPNALSVAIRMGGRTLKSLGR